MIKINRPVIRIAVLAISLLGTQAACARDRNVDAMIGGALGGVIGSIVGSQIGGRDGAVVGAGIGAIAGVAITANDGRHHSGYKQVRYVDERCHNDNRNDYRAKYRGHYNKHSDRDEYADRGRRDWDEGYRYRHYRD
jgi:uncharacterized protein YcfJ